MGNLVNSIKVTIGKEGAGTPGTPVATTAVVPIKAMPTLDRKPEKTTDPVIIGAGMDAGEYAVSADTKGGLSLAPRACAGFGQILKGAFGTETVSGEILAVIRLRYTGASASCKLTTDLGAKTINSKIGALGAEANDAAFGTAGTLTLTAITVDTVAELIAVIEAYADYEAKLITGSGDSIITSVIAGTFQAKGKWAILTLTGAGSGAYAHRFVPDLAAGSERPTFSVQTDGRQDNIKHAGWTPNTLDMSAALKAELDASVDGLAFTEAVGQGASGLALNDSKAFIFGGGITSIGGVDYNFVRNVSAKANLNLKADGYGQASLDRAYHAKGKFEFNGQAKLRLDAASYLERAKVESGAASSILLIFYAAESKKVGTSAVAELLIIEVAYSELSNFDFEDSSGQVDASLDWKAFAPGGAYNYDSPVVVTMVTSDVAVY
ncbi:MAG: hypothetical protein A2001_01430 [Treponema sp. GWC1_61_84]|nr:MAG: hypothetical protein A2001_01430 [Treponema sp. GWC1_61_84]